MKLLVQIFLQYCDFPQTVRYTLEDKLRTLLTLEMDKNFKINLLFLINK